MKRKLEQINCPYCNDSNSSLWGEENGFSAVKCTGCGIVYVNPRPSIESIDAAVTTGTHSEEANSINVVTHRIPKKTKFYKAIFADTFKDVWSKNQRISWLDVGSGFGEVLEAVAVLANKGSKIEGLEPMKPKAEVARNLGMVVHEKYLNELNQKYDFISLINVFSHIPDFGPFLNDLTNCLNSKGEVFIETGNVADMNRTDFQGVLSLPDHLVFSGESHIIGYLEKYGFEIVSIDRRRCDTLIESIKNIGRKLYGQPVLYRLPYTSPYRSLLIRARLKS